METTLPDAVVITLLAKARGAPQWERMDQRGREIFGVEWDESEKAIEAKLAEVTAAYRRPR